MRNQAEIRLADAIQAFPLQGKYVGAVRYGDGHINDTFCVYCQLDSGDVKRYILQRISSVAFKDPAKLMENIVNVTQYLQAEIIKNNGDERETMHLVFTKDNKPYYLDKDNEAWRVYDFVEGTYYSSIVENSQQFYESGRTFGRFQSLLAAYPAETLHETIANFHNTPVRLENFRQAYKADKLGRKKEVLAEIDFVEARAEDCKALTSSLEARTLPLKVTHNDTKLNNILFDKATHKGLCIIDLDTIMPGLVAYDFGDSIRFGASTGAEDEADLDKVHFDLNLFAVYTDGFLASTRGTLTQAEVDSLVWGSKLMTLECGMRFLADYLEGDIYFSINPQRPKHNLDRARTQFRLVSEMETKWEQMFDIVRKYEQA